MSAGEAVDGRMTGGKTTPVEPDSPAIAHLIALPGVSIQDEEQVEAVLRDCRLGVDFADALHLAASRACSELSTFDDRGYARRTEKLGLKPPVRLAIA